jgi:ketosteroid isomerase-like protein
MTDRDGFRSWVETVLYSAEVALHNGDAAPRKAIWSHHEPVSVLGAMRNARGRDEIDHLFTALAQSFSDCTAYRFELLTYDVVGDMAYTTGLEHVAVVVDGQPRTFSLRSTQIYRREAGQWTVVHRHADMVAD